MDSNTTFSLTNQTSSSSKNLLQEYAQKRNLILPIYVTNPRTYQDKIMWLSTVKLWNNVCYTGIECSSKSLAEKSAASYALNSLASENTKKTLKPISEKVYICVDMENQQKAIEYLLSEVKFPEDTYEIHGFTSSSIDESLYNRDYIDVYIHTTKSKMSDAADYKMLLWIGGNRQMFIKKSLSINPETSVSGRSTITVEERVPQQYVIITNDHFGKVLEHVSQMDEDEYKNIKSYSHVREFMKDYQL